MVVHKKRLGNRGFSLVEAGVSLAIGSMFLTTALSTWTMSTRVWREEGSQGKLRMDIERAMEKIKEDARLSDGNAMVFYPQNAATYTAVSMPRATATSGFLTFSGANIAWNKTVIYHTLAVGGKQELRKTVFSTYDASVTNRQTQLDDVAENGAPTSGTATTTTLFSSDAVSLEIVPQLPTFDGYSATTARSPNTSFGSVRLAAGSHEIKFQATGKNASSAGYEIGIDLIALNPSGCEQEAEALTVSSSSGQSSVIESMAGSWGGNHHREYQAQAIGDYFTLQTYYDQWLETNFKNMTHSNTAVTGTDPAVTLLSRESQGLEPAWQAGAQTQALAPENEAVTGKSVRTVLVGGFVTKKSSMIRLKFMASSAGDLKIDSAYFGVRQGTHAGGNGTSDFSGALTQLYFDNAPVVEGNPDPVGAMNPGGNSSVTVPAGYHVWSNWFEYTIDPVPSAVDFLVSFYSSDGSALKWTESPLPVPAPTFSYSVTGDFVTAADWASKTGYASGPGVTAVDRLAVWQNTGSVTSQIYDTKISAPVYNQVSWASVLPAGASITMKVRSSASQSMAGATDWSALGGSTSSPASLSGVSNARYVQFQATLKSAAPYASFPQMDNVKIDWPGQTALVDLSGYYTKRPDYGIFKVLVDGNSTVKALELKLSSTESYRGKNFNYSLRSEIKPRNTGK